MSAAENPFSAFIELMRKQAETVARPAWGWGEVVGTDPLSVMYNGVKLRPAQIVGAESLQGAAVGKRFPLIADADGQSFAVLGEQSGAPAWDEITGKPTAFTPDDHDHAVADITDFPATMPPSEHNHDAAYLGITAKAADSDKLDGNESSAFAVAEHNHGCPYAIGDILQTLNATSPATRFPGTTWAAIEGQFLFGASSTYAAGSTGGAATHVLDTTEIPSHRHAGPGSQYYGTGYSGLTPYLRSTTYGGGTPPVIQTGYEGGGLAHNNMPPYLAVYIWKRTA